MATRPYFRDRLIEDRPEGFVVIVPTVTEQTVPMSCPTCNRLLRTRDDETSWRELACCERCALIWAQPRLGAWKDGWRPSVEQVNQSNGNGLQMSITFDVD